MAGRIDSSGTVAELAETGDDIAKAAEGLDVLMQVINGLEIADTTQRTTILEAVGEVYGQLNRTRAQLDTRKTSLGEAEGRAEFGAQFAILSQTVTSYLGLCHEAEDCDTYLGKLMVQVEELESRFALYEAFADELAQKRDEIYEVFQGRKQALSDERQRRASALAKAAGRICDSVAKRALSFSDVDELNAYFAADAMVMKARSIVKDLTDLGDTVAAGDIESRLKVPVKTVCAPYATRATCSMKRAPSPWVNTVLR